LYHVLWNWNRRSNDWPLSVLGLMTQSLSISVGLRRPTGLDACVFTGLILYAFSVSAWMYDSVTLYQNRIKDASKYLSDIVLIITSACQYSQFGRN
jgi:hypothetical protein